MSEADLVKLREDIITKIINADDLGYTDTKIKILSNELEDIEKRISLIKNVNFSKEDEEMSLFSDLIETSEEVYDKMVKDFDRNIIFYSHENKKEREDSYINYVNPYLKKKEIIEYLFVKNVLDKNIVADKLFKKKYKECILNDDKISLRAFELLTRSIKNNNEISQSMIDLEMKTKKISSIHWYDLFYYPKKINFNYSSTSIQKIILSFVSSISIDINNQILTLLKKNMIITNKDIKSPYTISFFFEDPLILTPPIRNFDDLINLVHEIGHAIFQIKFTKNNSNTILDESFAIHFEFLFYEFLLNIFICEEKKKFILNHRIGRIRGLVFRQNIQTELELFIDKGLSDLEGKYQELLEYYFGNNIHHNIFSKHEYLLNSHFFDPYYSYKYSLGCLLSIYTLSKHKGKMILSDFFEIPEFLEKEEYLNVAFKQIEKWISELSSGL